MKILLIDDNQTITTVLSKILTREGHETVVSNDGRNGLSLIERGSFDVILLDILMREFSGLDVIDALCKSGKIKENKIIIMSAEDFSEDELSDLKDRGVYLRLKKPVQYDAILSTLKMACDVQ